MNLLNYILFPIDELDKTFMELWEACRAEFLSTTSSLLFNDVQKLELLRDCIEEGTEEQIEDCIDLLRDSGTLDRVIGFLTGGYEYSSEEQEEEQEE